MRQLQSLLLASLALGPNVNYLNPAPVGRSKKRRIKTRNKAYWKRQARKAHKELCIMHRQMPHRTPSILKRK